MKSVTHDTPISKKMERDPFWLHAEAILRSCCEDAERSVDAERVLHKMQYTHLTMRRQIRPVTVNDRIALGEHTRALLRSQLSDEHDAKIKASQQRNDDKPKATSVPATPVISSPSTDSTASPATSSSYLVLLGCDRSGATSPKIFRRTNTPWKSPLAMRDDA